MRGSCVFRIGRQFKRLLVMLKKATRPKTSVKRAAKSAWKFSPSKEEKEILLRRQKEKEPPPEQVLAKIPLLKTWMERGNTDRIWSAAFIRLCYCRSNHREGREVRGGGRMKRENGNEKPVVIVRKKTGKGISPTGPTRPKPHQAAPVAKTETPADPLPPPPKPQQPEASPQPQPTAAAALSKTAERKRLRNEVLEILRTRWPQTFPRDFREIRPWATGIAQDVVRLLPE